MLDWGGVRFSYIYTLDIILGKIRKGVYTAFYTGQGCIRVPVGPVRFPLLTLVLTRINSCSSLFTGCWFLAGNENLRLLDRTSCFSCFGRSVASSYQFELVILLFEMFNVFKLDNLAR